MVDESQMVVDGVCLARVDVERQGLDNEGRTTMKK